MPDQESLFGRLIHGYSRAQAIEDGVIVDVTETAKEAGFKYPVALTRAVWDAYVTVPPKVRMQDEKGRLWDILYMCMLKIKAGSQKEPGPVKFIVLVRNDNRSPKPVFLTAHCGPGDDPAPVITITLPSED